MSINTNNINNSVTLPLSFFILFVRLKKREKNNVGMELRDSLRRFCCCCFHCLPPLSLLLKNFVWTEHSFFALVDAVRFNNSNKITNNTKSFGSFLPTNTTKISVNRHPFFNRNWAKMETMLIIQNNTKFCSFWHGKECIFVLLRKSRKHKYTLYNYPDILIFILAMCVSTIYTSAIFEFMCLAAVILYTLISDEDHAQISLNWYCVPNGVGLYTEIVGLFRLSFNVSSQVSI